jgi:hypothetical protein
MAVLLSIPPISNFACDFKEPGIKWFGIVLIYIISLIYLSMADATKVYKTGMDLFGDGNYCS